jgi:hypothetical protein
VLGGPHEGGRELEQGTPVGGGVGGEDRGPDDLDRIEGVGQERAEGQIGQRRGTVRSRLLVDREGGLAVGHVVHLLAIDDGVVLAVARGQGELARRGLDARLHQIRLDPGDARLPIDLLAVGLEDVEGGLAFIEDPRLLENLEGGVVDHPDLPIGQHGGLGRSIHLGSPRSMSWLLSIDQTTPASRGSIVSYHFCVEKYVISE